MSSFINPGAKSYVRKSSLDTSPGISEDGSGGSSPMYGRVVDVILDSSHPRYKQLGGSQALYGIFYQPLFVRASEDIENNYNLRFAYCKQGPLRQIPIRTEIVQLEEGPAGAKIQERRDTGYAEDVYQEKIYWTSIVPVWNHPHLNVYPDVVRYDTGQEEASDLGEDFKENQDIKPLQLSSGDVVLEGRHGQSLRFGGTKSKIGSLSDSKSNGKPFTILRNGQAEASGSVCIEDIDKDDSSIYLTSDHKVPISEANHKFAGARKAPKLVRDYQGKQIVANSDQIFLNARKDNLELAAKEHASINAKTVSLDGEDYLGVDAKKVYLGTYAQSEDEPVLKGETSVEFMRSVCEALLGLLNIMSTSPNEAYAWVSAVKVDAGVTAESIKAFLAGIDKLKSKKVYTE